MANTEPYTGSTLLAESDPFARKFMADFFSDLGFSVTVADTLEEALCLLDAASQPFTLVVADLSPLRDGEHLFRRRGLGLVQHIKRSAPQTAVVVRSAFLAPAIVKLIGEGHAGIACVAKTSGMEQFRQAIVRSLAGDVYLDRSIIGALERQSADLFLSTLPSEVAGIVSRIAAQLGRLSRRERAVASRLFLTTDFIARDLVVREHTVRNYLDSIYTKLDLKEHAAGAPSLRRDTLVVLAVILRRLQQYGAEDDLILGAHNA